MTKTGMDPKSFSSPLPMRQVRIGESFWYREQEVVRTRILPYQWNALNDRIPDAAPSYCMHNFRAAAALSKKRRSQGENYEAPVYTFRGFEALPEDPRKPDPDKFYGFVFQDSDFSKWIEAVGYSLMNHPDEELEKTADAAIDIVCEAQLENGYLDTYYILNGMDRAMTNLADHHELYCMGHLIEGAVSYYQATGKDKLLKAAMRFADYMADYFMSDKENSHKGYPGHEIAEMALAKLYELTGEKRYLDLAVYFLNERGQSPLFFAEEKRRREEREGVKPVLNNIQTDAWSLRNPYSYNQAHKPVREQGEAVGHAVRAVYLYSGMADVARLTGDVTLYKACLDLWESITKEKLYITGGIGGTHIGEAFSRPYDLPNDTAYSETCAAIGLVFFARRMLQIDPDARFADVMEQALYNTVLAGKAIDGESFFYVNPLEAVPEALDRDARLLHVKMPRQKWFGCACCPPNIARTVSSLQSYAYTQNEDTLFVHLYAGSEVQTQLGGEELKMSVRTSYPWSGSVHLDLMGEHKAQQTIALRIPNWSKEAVLAVKNDGIKKTVIVRNGSIAEASAEGMLIEKGYLYLTDIWNDATIELELSMEPRILAANNAVREDIGKAAIVRGPLTYCLEEADNGKDLHLYKIDLQTLKEEGIAEEEMLIEGQKVTALKTPVLQERSERGENLYKDLLQDPEPQSRRISLTWVPYYIWGNRGAGEMSVYVRYQ